MRNKSALLTIQHRRGTRDQLPNLEAPGINLWRCHISIGPLRKGSEGDVTLQLGERNNFHALGTLGRTCCVLMDLEDVEAVGGDEMRSDSGFKDSSVDGRILGGSVIRSRRDSPPGAGSSFSGDAGGCSGGTSGAAFAGRREDPSSSLISPSSRMWLPRIAGGSTSIRDPESSSP